MKNKTTMIALMATSILLAGCGGGGGNTGGNTGGGEGGGKFTLQIFAGGYGTSAWQYALKLFEKDHPEYEINVNMDNNVNEQFANRWKRGNPLISFSSMARRIAIPGSKKDSLKICLSGRQPLWFLEKTSRLVIKSIPLIGEPIRMRRAKPFPMVRR